MEFLTFEPETIYQDEVTLKAVGAAAEWIEADPVPQDRILLLTYHGIIDETNNCTKFEGGHRDGAVFRRIYTANTPTGGLVYHHDGFILLREGQRPAAYITGPTAADIIRLTLEGLLYFAKADIHKNPKLFEDKVSKK